MASGAIDSVEIESEDGTAIGYEATGEGPGIVVVHGTFRAGRHYRALATELADTFTVYSMDRRGRGSSGPQGEDYDIDKECADLISVMEHTGATMVFGHSYGGLVALETVLRRPDAQITKLALYEPALSIGGTIDTGWLREFDHAVANGRTVDAVTRMINGMDLAGPLRHLPQGLRRALTRVALRGELMTDAAALLPTVHAEMIVVRELNSSGARYTTIETDTLVLSGARSPEYLHTAVDVLHAGIRGARAATVPQASHNGPDMDAPREVARHLRGFFGSAGG
ncbi:MAG TPA: alpha/beta hydrolase [Pseudonocardiaceae bacterium]|jgi:pimeloyl-ACP methyl ester carboxylesterase|nr:alpha/beta hydrolase [Pseudonocardiaceae bacterium]